ncbi:MAG: cytochrome c [Chloroflexi bacterium]|nr:cytochrome c [Chloroflexota bacterium]
MTWVFLGRAGALFFVAGAAGAMVLSACGAGEPGATASKALIERGAVLYQANCLTCHSGAKGGNIKDIPPPHNGNGHTWHHPDQQLIDITLNGLPLTVPGQKMPAFKDMLSEEDVQAILAYVKMWWTKDQRAWQATVTAQQKQVPQ